MIRIDASRMKDEEGNSFTGDTLLHPGFIERVHTVKGTAFERVIIHMNSGRKWEFRTDDADAILDLIDGTT